MEKRECFFCHQPLTKEQFDNHQVTGHKLYGLGYVEFHDRYRAITDCYAQYLILHLKENRPEIQTA